MIVIHDIYAGSRTVKQISGVALSRRARKWPAYDRAELASQLHNGDACAFQLAKRQAALLAGAKIKHLTAVEDLNADERAAVRRGDVSFVEALKSRRKPPTEAAISTFINRAGAEAVLNVLDRMTRPQPFATAAE
jgi:hypothetical protein